MFIVLGVTAAAVVMAVVAAVLALALSVVFITDSSIFVFIEKA